MPRNYAIRAELVWPVRGSVDACKVALQIKGQKFLTELDYPASISVAASITVPNVSWSRLIISWQQPFDGSLKDFRTWCSQPASQSKLIEKAEAAQSEFVDRLYRLNAADRQLAACIRHFGPRDWIAARMFSASQSVFELMGSGMLHLVSTRSVNPTPTMLSAGALSGEERTLHRAANLTECGYPTEGLLLAFSVLDSCVQRFLTQAMRAKGVSNDAAEQLLRNTTTKRLSTYLDSVLHLTTGQSLRASQPQLFNEVVRINGQRNDAIHNGTTASRALARDACRVVSSVLAFLDPLFPGVVSGSTQLTFVSPV